MKNSIKKTLILGAMALFIVGCQKEDDGTQPSASSISEDFSAKEKSDNFKSSYTEFELMAMAANIDEIDYDGTSYQISFHDATPDYTVDINSFVDSVAIDLDIATGSTTKNVDIDVVNEGIAIQNGGSYTFTQFEDYVISPTEDMFENLTVIMTIHHILFPNTDKSFDDNGSGDDFEVAASEKSGSKPRLFWGFGRCEAVDGTDKIIVHNGVPQCVQQWDCTRFRFWIGTGIRRDWAACDE